MGAAARVWVECTAARAARTGHSRAGSGVGAAEAAAARVEGEAACLAFLSASGNERLSGA